jgi:hypothetical protein
MKPILKALAVIVAIAASLPALAQQGTTENLVLGVDCRDMAELTRQFCFPYKASRLDAQLLPPMTGAASILDQRIDGDGCVTIKLSAWGEHRLTPQSPGSFQSRMAKATDPLQVPQCIATNANVIVRVQY